MELSFIFTSLMAGMLTVLAPCVLPLLPVVLSRSADSRLSRAMATIFGLAVGIVGFTLLLKGSTALIGAPEEYLTKISGVILILVGFFGFWPRLWDRIDLKKFGFGKLRLSSEEAGLMGSFLLGLSLGPVFSSCSPTFGIIVASVLPASLGQGLVYLSAYALGLSLPLLLISIYGVKLTSKIGWLLNPEGVARRVLSLLILVTGILVVTGWYHDLQAWIIDTGIYDPISDIESKL